VVTHHDIINSGGKIMELKVNEDRNSIKLMKMSKGYQWEIRLSDDDIESQLPRLEKIDADLRKKYNQE